MQSQKLQDIGIADIDWVNDKVLLRQWNKAHDPHIRQRWVTFIVQCDKVDTNVIISTLEQYPYWAYALHDRDVHKDGSPVAPHYHCYAEVTNPRSLLSWADAFGIPVVAIQAVRDKSQLLQYFTHSNNPDKYVYPKDILHTNMDISDTSDNLTVYDEWGDYCKVRMGIISANDFVIKYSSCLKKCNFASRLSIFAKLYDTPVRVRDGPQHAGTSPAC